MHELPEAEAPVAPESPGSEAVAELSPEIGPEQECWSEDEAWARYALEDGEFAGNTGYVVAVFQKKIVDRGKNPLHLRTRLAK
jgi:hypothetical protein